MILLHEKGLLAQVEKVRTAVTVTAPHPVLMADNPLSQIPTLVLDDGNALYDSRVICEYLDDLGGAPRLLPTPGPDRWRALRRQSLADGLVDVALLWRHERERDFPSAAHGAAFAAKSAAALDALETEAPRFAGERFDLGHISVGVALSYLDFRFPDLEWRRGRPAAAAWHAMFRTRPSAIATEIVDDG